MTHTHTHRLHSVELLWTTISPNQRPLPDNTQHSKETDIHTPSGIRTRNPSKREVVEPHLRQHGHRDRLFVHYLLKINFLLHAKDVFLLFYPEEGGEMLLRKVGIFYILFLPS